MKAVLVSVDYTDLLRVTLPYNRHHFESVTVITSVADLPNVLPVCDANGAAALATDLFYADGAVFNKWRALEWGLDRVGRDGWICLMDADVLWPRDLRGVLNEGGWLTPGFLYTPLRRMFVDTYIPVPPERSWSVFPVHRNVNEWAGYSQIFHGSDPVLGPPPWHEIDWRHAGGADSFFQMKWPREKKIRPPFEVLHLGPAGENWCGRATLYLDGTLPDGAEEKRELVKRIWAGRRERKLRHGPDSDVYRDEKL